MTKPMPQRACCGHTEPAAPTTQTKTQIPTQGIPQTVNGRQYLKCSAPDGTVRFCMDSQAYSKDAAVALDWPEATTENRAKIKELRTWGYKLCRARCGTLYPLIDYIDFMIDPEGALANWTEAYGIRPVERKPIKAAFRNRERVCECPAVA